MAFGDAVYFIADDGVHGRELWKSDGSAEGTDIVVDFAPDFAGVPSPAIKAVVGEYLYFCRYIYDARVITYCEFYRTDGTAAGTSLIGTYTDDAQSPPFEWIASYDDVVYYGSLGAMCRLSGASAQWVEMQDSALGIEAAASARPLPVLWGDRLYMQSKAGDLWSIDASGGEGTLRVFIEPSEVLDLGAEWAVDGGEWHESGETVALPPGEYTVSFSEVGDDAYGCFKPCLGWTPPADIEVTITEGETLPVTGTYTRGAKSSGAGTTSRNATGDLLLVSIMAASVLPLRSRPARCVSGLLIRGVSLRWPDSGGKMV
jgi:ELWxxDGT repeat protein